MPRPAFIARGLIALLSLPATVAAGQSSPEAPSGEPGGTGGAVSRAEDAAGRGVERARDAEGRVPNERGDASKVSPTPPGTASAPRPGLTGGIDWLAGLTDLELDVPAPMLMAERTFLAGRRGVVLRAPGGAFVFVPGEPEPGEEIAPGEGPLLLLPCTELARIESTIGEAEQWVPFTVTGEVFVYGNRNHLLPSAAARVLVRDEAGEPETDPGAAGDGAEEDGAGEDGAEAGGGDGPDVFNQDDPRVTELIEALERRSGAAVEESQLRGSRGVSPQPAPRRALINEGTLIFQRRGRAVRDQAGRVTVRFDNDLETAGVDGTLDEGAAADHELVVLPCRLLERLERETEFDASPVPIMISGRVYTYGAENYLLPHMYQLSRYSEIAPGQ